MPPRAAARQASPDLSSEASEDCRAEARRAKARVPTIYRHAPSLVGTAARMRARP